MADDALEQPWTSPTVADAIHAELRDRILKGVFPPGSLLRQEELARQFGASRVPLREAMSRLEVEGLLLVRPRRGYAVRNLDPVEIVEIFDLRAAVEEHLGGLAAKARSEHDIERVSDAVAEMERIAADKPNDTSQWLNANAAFHAALLAAAHRKHAARFAAMLRDQVEPYIRIEIELTKEVMQAETEHRQMLEALQKADSGRLRQLCRKHCENTASRLVAALDARLSKG
ncbi:GntR family transcriptional regulator [Mesorhizobium sp. M7A.F.Ca.US.001.04.1.1]|uniref:GntR family transcriptional regulator n=1 Tax=unclassified Mesorhizobium TaxID=325217 RepID=UPI000FC9F977|nr:MULTISPECIES: GntR family transcriptional regulator [unclassified Mesorhizobium]RUY27345.1 GntR family transcriptional regulator [Mesorhizobium sp. M7A.F.Ca.US.001.04.2.1]RUY39391.1 GntR family transcriptional regulator [Mesorhizobium sp. M7A.F.Ca.US.001.04.1.1]